MHARPSKLRAMSQHHNSCALRCCLDDCNAVARHNRGVASLVDAQVAALPKIPYSHRSKPLWCESGPRNADIGGLNREVQEHECECTIAQGLGEDLRAVTKIYNGALDAPRVLPQQQQHCLIGVHRRRQSQPVRTPHSQHPILHNMMLCIYILVNSADNARQYLIDSKQFIVGEVRQGWL